MPLFVPGMFCSVLTHATCHFMLSYFTLAAPSHCYCLLSKWRACLKKNPALTEALIWTSCLHFIHSIVLCRFIYVSITFCSWDLTLDFVGQACAAPFGRCRFECLHIHKSSWVIADFIKLVLNGNAHSFMDAWIYYTMSFSEKCNNMIHSITWCNSKLIIFKADYYKL